METDRPGKLSRALLTVFLSTAFLVQSTGHANLEGTSILPPSQAVGSSALFVHGKLEGGWRLELNADPEHAALHVPFLSPTGQALLLASVTSGDFRRLVLSTAALIGVDGTVLVSLPLSGLMAHASVGDVSPNGRCIALLASPYSDPNQEMRLLVFDNKGSRLSSRETSPERELLVGNDWIAFWTSPLLAAYEEQEDAPLVSQTALPAEFIRPDGTPFRSRDRIGGALAKMGDGLAAVTGGTLSTYTATLTRRGRASLGFPVGIPYAARQGSLVAVAEYTTGPDKRSKQLVFFDGDAKKLGRLTLRAALGIEAAVSLDGTAVLATPASLGAGGPELYVEDSPTIELVLADRTGKIRWRHTVKHRAKYEYVAYLAVSSGGRRAAYTLKSEDEKPDQVVVLDEKGVVLYRSESLGNVGGLWFDPSGESILLAADLSFLRQRIDTLMNEATAAELKTKQHP